MISELKFYYVHPDTFMVHIQMRCVEHLQHTSLAEGQKIRESMDLANAGTYEQALCGVSRANILEMQKVVQVQQQNSL